jgi:hypothetical protein
VSVAPTVTNGAPTNGVPVTPIAAPAVPAPATPEAKKPEETQADFALRLVREQRARGKAEADAKAALKRAEAAEKERDDFRSWKEKQESANKAWGEGKYVDALRSVFGKGLPENLLVELASAQSEQPEPMSPEQLRESIRAELRAEQEALRVKEKQEEDERSAQLQQMRDAAVQEVAQTLTSTPEKWPTVWALGVTGDQIAEAMDAAIKEKGKVEPEAVFEAIEKEYRERVLGLPYLPKDGSPAPRSFGGDAARGPVDYTNGQKPPEKAAERWEWRRQQHEAWKKSKFGGA